MASVGTWFWKVRDIRITGGRVGGVALADLRAVCMDVASAVTQGPIVKGQVKSRGPILGG